MHVGGRRLLVIPSELAYGRRRSGPIPPDSPLVFVVDMLDVGLMASISRDDVAHVARLARLELTDEELDTFTGQLAAVLEHAADVEALDVDDVPPTSHPFELTNVAARRRGPARRSTATRCSARPRPSAEHRFKVPPVLGEEP